MSHQKPNNNKNRAGNYEQRNNLKKAKESVRGAEVPSTLDGPIQSPGGQPLIKALSKDDDRYVGSKTLKDKFFNFRKYGGDN